MDPEESPFRSSLIPDWTPAAETQLVQQLRQGDAEAGHQFVRDYYPGVYRYLLYLTGRREAAEDLTQETFLQAWRRLDTFAGRAPRFAWVPAPPVARATTVVRCALSDRQRRHDPSFAQVVVRQSALQTCQPVLDRGYEQLSERLTSAVPCLTGV